MNNHVYSEAHTCYPDTAIKVKTTRISSSTAILRTKAADVQRMIQDEITTENLHVAETDDFLAKLFPVDSAIVETVYNALVQSQAYDAEKKWWKNFPEGKVAEQGYYKPFTEAVESIRTASPGSGILHCRWVDRHNTPPKSLDTAAALIRPDILSLLSMKDNGKLEDEIDRCEDEVSTSYLFYDLFYPNHITSRLRKQN